MEFDTQHGPWASDGPSLKLEFSRISEKRLRALTLVIDTEHGIKTTVAWCVSNRGTLAEAMTDLRVREETTPENIGRATDAGALNCVPSEAGIGAWARTKNSEGLSANVFRNSEYTLFLTTSHIVKYHFVVHIVTRKHLHEAMRQYPDAANEIKAWVVIVKEVRWHNFPEVRSAFKDADNVKGYVVFNIRQNRYRLVTVIHYAKTVNQKRTRGHVYIRSFLTHKEYDNPANWDRKFGTK